jgi:hypothetical protein
VAAAVASLLSNSAWNVLNLNDRRRDLISDVGNEIETLFDWIVILDFWRRRRRLAFGWQLFFIVFDDGQ